MTDRHGIGGNNPPASEAMGLHVTDLFKLISDTTDGAEVTTDEQEAALADLMDQARQSKKDAEATRKAEKQPHMDAGKAVDAKWKPITQQLDAAIDQLKNLLTPYRTAKQAAKDEAARKAREEADRKAEQAREELQQSESLEDRFGAEQKIEQAAKLTAVANKIDRSATGLRTFKVVEVTDHKAALIWIAKNDKPDLDAFIEEHAKRHAPNRPMDGVTVREEKRAA